MDHMSAIGKRVQELAKQGPGRGTDQRAGQETHSSFLLADNASWGGERLAPPGHSGGLAFSEGPGKPLLIKKPQQRCLSDRTQPAPRHRVLGVPFELDGPAVAVSDQSPASRATAAA